MSDFSKDDPLPFDPRDPANRGKLWVRVVTPSGAYRHFFWRRIAVACVVLAIAGWLGVTGGVWLFVKFQRGYREAAYLDLVLYPLRAEHYRAGLGRHYLAQGRLELEQKNYRTGYQLLLAGLARMPDDVEGRRIVASTQVRLGHADLALKTLADGALLATADLDYLKLLFALLLEAHEDDRVLALASQLLPPKPDEMLTHQFVALESATADFERGRYDAAERLLVGWRLTDSLEGEILLARCDWERGFPEAALFRLEREITRFPDREELYLYLVRFHRELGHPADARRYALLRQFKNPAIPGPRIDLLRAYYAAGDHPAEVRELAAYLSAFKSDPVALTLLAWFAVDTVQPALASQVHDLALSQRFPINPFNLARIQCALAVPDYQSALGLADVALKEANESNPDFEATLNGLRAIALFGRKEVVVARLALTAFLDKIRLRASDALIFAYELRMVDAATAAREVLDRACMIDPLNQAALSELVRLDAVAGNHAALLQNLPKLLRMNKPSRPVLRESLLHLLQPGDAPLREQVRAALDRVTATPAPG